MELRLQGKTAVVTGASKGIGLAIARGLAAEGVDLVLAARSADLLERNARELSDAHGVRAFPYAADLATADGVEGLATFAPEQLGHVDILVNNAGAIPAGTIEGLDDESWHSAYDLKLWGYVRLAKALLPRMKVRRSGVILNIIGNAGKRPSAGYIAGGLANAGLMNFTAALAQEAGPFGVRAVGINPGLTRTERMAVLNQRNAEDQGITLEEYEERTTRGLPLRRVGEAEEVADVAVFLVSDRASYVNGCVVPVEGGASAAI
jgi:NAD(P)-dependent dehydrogenase (short-subunit alcohol dehydrogenase family)